MARFGEVARALVGGAVTYVAMSACAFAGPSYGDEDPPSKKKAAAAGAGGAGAASVAGSGGVDGSGGAPGMGGGAPVAGAAGKAGGASMMNPVPDAEAKSGARLRAKVVTGADGSSAVIFGSWFDSQRKEPCTFTETPAGTRCLPAAGAYLGGYFADAGCTSALAVYATSQCSTTPKYLGAALASADGCSGVTRLFVAQAYAGPVYVGSAASCTKATLPSTYAVLSGLEVNYADFVAGTVSYE